MPKLLCVCGPNGAGKSTFTRSIALRSNLLVIDPDQLAAEGLSPLAAGKAAASMARLFLEKGISFARESTLTAKFDFKIIAEARKRGYEIELVYIKLSSPDLALQRVAARVSRGGHDVPKDDIVRRYSKSLENLHKYRNIFDKVTIIDNSDKQYIVD